MSIEFENQKSKAIDSRLLIRLKNLNLRLRNVKLAAQNEMLRRSLKRICAFHPPLKKIQTPADMRRLLDAIEGGKMILDVCGKSRQPSDMGNPISPVMGNPMTRASAV